MRSTFLHMSTHHHLHAILAALLLTGAALLAACQSEERIAGDGDDVRVSITLTPSAITGVEEQEVANDDELIQSWWIVFVREKDKLIRTIVTDALSGDAVRQDEFEIKMSPGNYVAYAFANIPQAEVEAAIATQCGIPGFAFAEGGTMPDISDVVWSTQNGMTGALPMCNRQEITLTGRYFQEVAIEVIRMVGKLEFVFTNPTTTPVTVQYISLQDISADRAGNVYLLPRIAPETDNGPEVPDGTLWDEEKFSFTTYEPTRLVAYDNATPANNHSHVIPAGGAFTAYTYVNETPRPIDTKTESFLLQVAVDKDEFADAHIRYALTNDDFGNYINWNDHLRIPITLTRYVFRLEAMFSPPIGGYPTAEIEEKEDNSFWVQFRGFGHFTLRPYLSHLGYAEDTSSEWIPLNDATHVESCSAEVLSDETYADPSVRILDLTEVPIGIDDSGWINGYLNGNEGEAVIRVTVTVISETDEEAGGTTARRVISRDFHVFNGVKP